MIDINKITIGKEINYGTNGSIYEAFYKDNKYALKINNILEKSINNKKSKLYIALEFNKIMNNKYPNLFMKLYCYDIIKNCTHITKRREDYERYT